MVKNIIEEKNIDLNKYIGEWYEISSIPARFQRNCENTKAKYTLKDDYIEVYNSCNNIKKNKMSGIKGKAFTTDKNNVLKVQFFWPFKADYNIAFVDKKYNYAVVKSKSDNYGWILSRDEKISDEKYNYLLNIADERGINIEKMKKTNH